MGMLITYSVHMHPQMCTQNMATQSLLRTTGNNDVQTQTDAFLDRPPTPLFVPAKTGMDVTTRIEEGDVSMH